MSIDQTTPYYCVTHTAPPWPLPHFMTPVGTGHYVPQTGLALSRSYPDLAHENRLLGEYAALFVLRQLLADVDPQRFVGLAHYRRFLLTEPVGTLQAFSYVAHPDQLANVPHEHFVADGGTPMIPAVVDTRASVLQQYASAHVASDLLHFIAIAVEEGVLRGDDAANFLSGSHMIASPSVAYVPVGWFVDLIGAVERVARIFRQRHFVEREGYQMRSMGFCCERLHGWLLLRRALEWGIDRLIVKPVVVLSMDGQNRPTV